MTFKCKTLPVLATVLSWRSCSPLVVPGPLGGIVPGRSALISPSASTRLRASTLSSSSPAASSSSSSPPVGPRIPIDETYPGLRRVHADPDVYVVERFLDSSSCDDLVARASERTMERSPVAYAGWTSDLRDLLELAAKGPVSWLALLGAWYQTDRSGGGNAELIVRAAQNFAGLFALAAAGIAAFTKSRVDGLQELRTSTSTTVDDLSGGEEGGGGGGGGGGGASSYVPSGTQAHSEADPLTHAPTDAEARAETYPPTDSEADAEARPETHSQADSKTDAETHSGTYSTADAEARPDTHAGADSTADAEALAETHPQADSLTYAPADVSADAEARAETHSKARARPDSRARSGPNGQACSRSDA